MTSQDVRQIVNAYSRVVIFLKKSILPFIFSGYRITALAVTSLERMIEIGNPVFSKAGITPDAMPGMQVTVNIIGGKRTVIDYVLTPIKRAADVVFREK